MILRPYQQACLEGIKANLDAGIYRQLVVAATGTGLKLEIALHHARTAGWW
jgi:superfamily II DNA or RNA helicase